jgi:hypothetical protein
MGKKKEGRGQMDLSGSVLVRRVEQVVVSQDVASIQCASKPGIYESR